MERFYLLSSAALVIGGLLCPARAETFTTLYRFSGGQTVSNLVAIFL